MTQRKSNTQDFKSSVLEWMFEGKNNSRTSYAAERHFSVQGKGIDKQTKWLDIKTKSNFPKF